MAFSTSIATRRNDPIMGTSDDSSDEFSSSYDLSELFNPHQDPTIRNPKASADPNLPWFVGVCN
jgi:hypothetical protein